MEMFVQCVSTACIIVFCGTYLIVHRCIEVQGWVLQHISPLPLAVLLCCTEVVGGLWLVGYRTYTCSSGKCHTQKYHLDGVHIIGRKARLALGHP